MNDRMAQAVEGMQLVVACVTHQHFIVSPSLRMRASAWSIEFREPAPLRGHGLLRGSRFAIEVDLRQSASAGEALVARYAYTLFDHAGRELLAFHWHPHGSSPIAFPHLHVSAALRGTTPSGAGAVLPLDKVHIPTGCLSVADAVRLLVAELGVGARTHDWTERLGRALPMLPAFPA